MRNRQRKRHNGALLTHEKGKEFPLFAITCMDVEPVMPSELSHTEKDKYGTISLPCGVQINKKTQTHRLWCGVDGWVVARGGVT